MQGPTAATSRPFLRRLPFLRYALFTIGAVVAVMLFDFYRNSGGDIRDAWLGYKIERFIKAHPELSASDRRDLRAGHVVKGWNREKCRLAWGEPDDVLVLTQTQSELWRYGGETRPAVLYFTNGILTGWYP
jgi:hypothetical protein